MPKQIENDSKKLVEYNYELNEVNVWSIQRLPFEPEGWLKDLRSDMRLAIHQLRNQPGCILHAIYGSSIDGTYDLENVLFYNIATSHFSSVDAYGVRFERQYSYPDPPYLLETSNLHYYQYKMVDPNATFLNWQVGTILAEWENVQISRSADVTAIWYAMKLSKLKSISVLNVPRRFGLSLTIRMPLHASVKTTRIAKALIDGVVSAFHIYNGNMVEALSQVLANKLNTSPDVIARFLLQSDQAVLGARDVVRTYGKSCKWNPADDMCFAAKILIQPYSGKDYSLSGKLFELTHRSHV